MNSSEWCTVKISYSEGQAMCRSNWFRTIGVTDVREKQRVEVPDHGGTRDVSSRFGHGFPLADDKSVK